MRYFLFAHAHYYPGGGWDDFVKAFDDLDEAKEAGRESSEDNWHIVDTEILKVVSGKFIDNDPVSRPERW